MTEITLHFAGTNRGAKEILGADSQGLDAEAEVHESFSAELPQTDSQTAA